MNKRFLSLLFQVLLPFIVISLCLILVSARAWASDVILKIPVTQEGVVRFTYNELGYYGQPYGVDPKEIIPGQIHIYNRGQDVAFYFNGDEDGQFNQGDYIEFYGIPIQPEDPEYKYTGENIYWLKVDTTPSVRMSTWESSGSGTPESFFLHTYHAERNWVYWETMPNGLGIDHWFWGQKISAGAKQDYTFYLSNIANTTNSATVRVYLHGRTDDSANPDHRTSITLNGNYLGDVVWDGQKPVTYSFENVPQSYLNADNVPNTLTVEETGNPEANVDSIYLNWVEVDYYKNFTAEGDSLKFTARGNGVQYFSITNFSGANIQVFDVSDPYNVRRLSKPSITPSGNKYTVKFSDTLSGEATYLIVAGSYGIKDFPSIFYLSPQTLKDTGNGADYVIITHETFKEAVLPLAQHRESQGYRIKVVTTQEIYDEFSGGIFTPRAIKDFLKYSYENWKQPAPEFVLLVGDANVDYKDYWKTGQINYVPTYLIDTTIVGETPSDHWFVTIAGDDPLPDMLIGRIPAKTVDEVNIMVHKIIAYETGGMEEWHHRVLLAANDDDPRFKEYSEEWATHIPSNYLSTRVYVSDYDDKNQPGTDLLKNLNDGVLMTSFFGHGSVDLWAASHGIKLLTSDDVVSPTLANQGKLSFVAAFNCLNGLFAEPSEGKWITLPDGTSILYAVPLPEALLFQDGRGAIAMWSPSAFAYPSEQQWIGHELYSGLFEQRNNILGSVTTLAKVNAFVKKGIYVENLDVFTFFGDPATRLPLDVKENGSSSGSGGGGCFIATAAYGSYLHPYVKILRDFRDQILLLSDGGRKFVELYYQYSPPAADWIARRAWAKSMTQVILIPVVFSAWLIVAAPGWIKVLVLLGLSLLLGVVILTRFKRRRISVLFLTILFVLGFSIESLAWAGDSDIQVIHSDRAGLLVELVLPPYRVVKKADDGVTYNQIEVEEYGFIRETGKPLLPMRGTLIAIPEEGEVTLNATPGEYETLFLNIGPAGIPSDAYTPTPDPEVYGKDAFYPDSVIARGFTGYMRDQKVMQILFYPMQYNPVTGEVRIYKTITLNIKFKESVWLLKKPIPTESKGEHSRHHTTGAYEKLLKGLLLNYPGL